MTQDELALVVLIAFAVLVFGVLLRVASKRKGIVRANSTALRAISELNNDYAPRLQYFSPIRYAFVEEVGSKSKFDRFDLEIMFYQHLAAMESSIDWELKDRTEARALYATYAATYDRHGQTHLGKSGSAELEPDRFQRIERRLFGRMRLREPQCKAQFSCTVTYTSPQGRNSYRRSREWDFGQLSHGLAELRRIHEQRSTTEFLRRQERNRMTSRLRAEVLRRDGSRCRMCGTTPSHGAVMHIDHIIPVSRGGQTVASNLQALCQDCNLGKSNVI